MPWSRSSIAREIEYLLYKKRVAGLKIAYLLYSMQRSTTVQNIHTHYMLSINVTTNTYRTSSSDSNIRSRRAFSFVIIITTIIITNIKTKLAAFNQKLDLYELQRERATDKK